MWKEIVISAEITAKSARDGIRAGGSVCRAEARNLVKAGRGAPQSPEIARVFKHLPRSKAVTAALVRDVVAQTALGCAREYAELDEVGEAQGSLTEQTASRNLDS